MPFNKTEYGRRLRISFSYRASLRRNTKVAESFRVSDVAPELIQQPALFTALAFIPHLS
ncbi:CTP synthase, partial [Clarias magur]